MLLRGNVLNLAAKLTGMLVTTVLLQGSAFASQETGNVPITSSVPEKKFILSKTDANGMLQNEKTILNMIGMKLTPVVFRSGRQFSFGLQSTEPGLTKVEYNGETDAWEVAWRWQQAINYNQLTASFPVKIVEQDNNFEVTVTCPSSMKADVRSFALFGIPQWDYRRLSGDIDNACASLSLPQQQPQATPVSAENTSVESKSGNAMSEIGKDDGFKKLEKLKALKDKGIISDADYEKKKNEILETL